MQEVYVSCCYNLACLVTVSLDSFATVLALFDEKMSGLMSCVEKMPITSATRRKMENKRRDEKKKVTDSRSNDSKVTYCDTDLPVFCFCFFFVFFQEFSL